MTFSEYGSSFIGDFNFGGGTRLDTHHVGSTPVSSIVFFIYQGMFATITPALMFGSSAERIRILPALLFIFVWTTVVYDPIAYWVRDSSKLGINAVLTEPSNVCRLGLKTVGWPPWAPWIMQEAPPYI